MSKTKVLSISILLIAIMLAFVSGCKTEDVPDAQDLFKSEKIDLSQISNIALVTFVSRSGSCPHDTTHHILTQKLWKKFQSSAYSDTVLNFIPLENIVNNDYYRMLVPSNLPDGAFSPINGLSYIKYGIEGGFDCEPLLKELNADALFIVLIKWGNAIRNNGTTPYIKANVTCSAVIPPEKVAWKLATTYEEQIPITIFQDPLLMASIGIKWIFLMPPSESDYAKLMKHALVKNGKFPESCANQIYGNLAKAIKKVD